MISVLFHRYEKQLFYKDLSAIFLMEKEEAEKWMPQTKINCDEELDYYISNRFKNYYHEFFVITDNNQKFIGIIYSHNYHANDDHLMITTVIKKEYQKAGYGVVASIKFMDFLFSHYSLRKIFISVYSYNTESIKNCLKAGFIEEGCLKEYRYYNGKYHDLHYLSISKESFYKILSKILNVLKSRAK